MANIVTLSTVESKGASQDFNDFADGTFGADARKAQLVTYSEDGNVGKTMLIENSSGYRQRRNVEIQIDNSKPGNADQILRIGGVAGTAGAAQLFNLPAGAADDPVIEDQYGVGCKFTQGFCYMTEKGIYIRDFQVLSDVDNSPQLRQQLERVRLYFNGNNTIISDPAAITFEMSDQRKNMMKDRDSVYYINSLNWFQYKIIAGFKGSLLFEIVSADLTATMNVLK